VNAATDTKRWTDTECRALLAEADQAGWAAGQAAQPIPMQIFDPRTGHAYEPVTDGVCGFASIIIRGVGPLANYAKRTGQWTKGYRKGLTRYVHEFNQSLTRKEAFAHAYVKVLRAAGFDAHIDSRLD